MRKRILSMLLAVCMLASVFSTAAFALDVTGGTVDAVNFFYATSGNTNDHLTTKGIFVQEDGTAYLVFQKNKNRNWKEAQSVTITVDGKAPTTLSYPGTQYVSESNLTIELQDGDPVVLQSQYGFVLISLGQLTNISTVFMLATDFGAPGWDFGGIEFTVNLSYQLTKQVKPAESDGKPVDTLAVDPGADVEYTVTIENLGDYAVSNINVYDDVPAYLTVNAVENQAPDYNLDGRLLLDQDITLAAGASKSYTISATVSSTVPGGAVITNTAVMESQVLLPAEDTATVTVNPYFLVYHQATGETDRIMMSDLDGDTFDITQPLTKTEVYNGVTNGYIYGGIYTDTLFNTPITAECGKILEPENNRTYYVKEVDKRYLCPSLYATYDRHDDNLLKQVYLVTSIDDQNYQKVGFHVDDTPTLAQPVSLEANTVYERVQVMRRVSWFNQEQEVYATYGLADFFPDLAGEDGLLNVQKYSDYRDGNGTLAPGYEYTVQPYFVTPDSVKVTGMKIRYVYLGNGRYTADGGLHVADEETFSTTEVYTQPSAARTLSLRSTFFISWDADEDVVEPEIVITKVDGGEVTSQTVEAGDQTGKIGYSEKDGYYFAGWFLDEALNVPADFSNVEESMTVYAKYISASDLRILVSVQGKHARDYDLSLSAQSGCQFAQAGFLCSFQGGTEDAQAGVDEDGLFSAIWSVSGLKNKSAFSVTPYWVTLDGTPVYAGQADYMLQGNSIVSK